MNSSENVFYKILDIVINYLLLVLCIVVFLNVIGRTFFTSLTWTIEVSRILVTYFIFLGALVASCEKSHVYVDLLVNRLSKKMQTVCNAINSIIIFAVLAVVALGSYELIIANRNINFLVTNLPYSFLYGVEFVVVISMMLMIVKDFINYLKNKLRN